MVETGTIKEIGVIDGQIEMVVSLSSGSEKTAVLCALSGINVYPLPGDVVEVEYSGGEYVVNSVLSSPLSELNPGESILFSRNASGAIQSKIRCTNDGEIILTDGTESAVRGDTLKSWLDAHTHPTAFGPSGPPSVPLPDMALNETVKL